MHCTRTFLNTLLLTALFFTSNVLAQGSEFSSMTEMAEKADALKPGEWVWAPEIASAGPVLVYVDLSAQIATVYRNGIRIGVTTVSTGRPGHETPTGVFTILQKDADHHSNIYNNAAMPFQERLTWGGVALHAGGLPGYPESHGCVHLPYNFAKELFQITSLGGTVIISGAAGAPVRTHTGGLLAPGTSANLELSASDDERDRGYEWRPDLATDGPVTIIMSLQDQRIIVLRNGTEIGRAKAKFPHEMFATHVLTLTEGDNGEPQWVFVNVPGHANEAGRPLDASIAERIHMPAAFREAVVGMLQPGATVLVTPAPITEQSTGQQLTVLSGADANSGTAEAGSE